MPEISRSTRMSLINGVPLNEDALSVNDKFFPTIEGKRKPAQVRATIFRSAGETIADFEVAFQVVDWRKSKHRDPVARVKREREKRGVR